LKVLLIVWVALLVGFSTTSDAKSFIWKVEKDGREAYIGGTIHLLRSQDLNSLTPYEAVYQKADTLVFEVDGDEMMSAAFKMSQMGMYQDGRTLAQALRPDVFAQLKQFCERHKFPLEPMMSMKPAMVNVTIAMGIMMRAGFNQQGIDSIFTLRAKRDNKPRLALETVDDQLNALFNHNEDPNALILATIKDGDKADTMIIKMVEGVFNGDTQLFEKEFLQPMKQEMPGFYDSLIVKRNNNWMPKIEAMLQTPQVEFVLVGALHLVGDIGIIEQLQSRGYKVTQLN
jgi:hypothetical protein